MKIVAAILLTAVAFGASAETKLYTENSRPGETMDEFIVRIAPRALRFTERSSFEVCGPIVKTDTGYSLTLYTSSNMTRCQYPKTSDIGFHTHPSRAYPTFYGGDYHVEGYMAHQKVINLKTVRPA